MKHAAFYAMSRHRETALAREIVEQLKIQIDQGCGLGVEHLAIGGRFSSVGLCVSEAVCLSDDDLDNF